MIRRFDEGKNIGLKVVRCMPVSFKKSVYVNVIRVCRCVCVCSCCMHVNI